MSYRICFLIFLCGFLTACAIFQGNKRDNHYAVCKELKRQIIWSGAKGFPKLWQGATGDPLQATQQRAENETLLRNYREEGCLEEETVDGGT